LLNVARRHVPVKGYGEKRKKWRVEDPRGVQDGNKTSQDSDDHKTP